MNVFRNAVFGSLVMLLSFLIAGNAFASQIDKKTGREREIIRKLQQAQQQFEAEKAQLQKEKDELNEKLTHMSKERDGAKAELIRENKKIVELEKDLGESKKEVIALNGKVQESQKIFEQLSQKHKDTLQTLSSRDKEVVQLKSDLSDQARALKTSEGRNASCEEKNLKLYQLNVELMSKYRNKGFLDTFIQNEPFTQLKNVEIENMLQDYRDRLDAERVNQRKH